MTAPAAQPPEPGARSFPVVVLVSVVDRRILPALQFVSRLPYAQLRALHISVDAAETRRLTTDWLRLDLSWLPLHICPAGADPDVAGAVRSILDDEASSGVVTVVVPELTIERWWHPLLHRQTARRIVVELQHSPDVLPVIVPLSMRSSTKTGLSAAT